LLVLIREAAEKQSVAMATVAKVNKQSVVMATVAMVNKQTIAMTTVAKINKHCYESENRLSLRCLNLP